MWLRWLVGGLSIPAWVVTGVDMIPAVPLDLGRDQRLYLLAFGVTTAIWLIILHFARPLEVCYRLAYDAGARDERRRWMDGGSSSGGTVVDFRRGRRTGSD